MIIAGKFIDFNDDALFTQEEVEQKINDDDFNHFIEFGYKTEKTVDLFNIAGEILEMKIHNGAGYAKIKLFTSRGYDEQKIASTIADKIAMYIEHGIPVYLHPYGCCKEANEFWGVYVDENEPPQKRAPMKILPDKQ